VLFRSLADEENTPFTVVSGSWKIVSDTINGEEVKAIECVSDGILSIPVGELNQSPADLAYGTYEAYFYKGGANTLRWGWCNDVAAAYEDASQNGYGLAVNSVEIVRLSEMTNGTITSITITDTGVFPVATYAHVKFTREGDDTISLYLDGTLVTAASGSNPIVDSDHTSGKFMTFDFDAGDKFVLADRTGKYSFVKKLGV